MNAFLVEKPKKWIKICPKSLEIPKFSLVMFLIKDNTKQSIDNKYN